MTSDQVLSTLGQPPRDRIKINNPAWDVWVQEAAKAMCAAHPDVSPCPVHLRKARALAYDNAEPEG